MYNLVHFENLKEKVFQKFQESNQTCHEEILLNSYLIGVGVSPKLTRNQIGSNHIFTYYIDGKRVSQDDIRELFKSLEL